MLSMTGYAEATHEENAFSISVTIKSYNSRYLELSKNIAYALGKYESEIDALLRKSCARGHIDLSVKLKVYEGNTTIKVDHSRLDAYTKAFSEVRDKSGVSPLFSDYILRDGILVESDEKDSDFYHEALISVLTEALEKLKKEKEREGQGTYNDLKRLGEELSDAVSFISSKSDEMTEYFRSVINQRYEELMQDKKLDDDRMMSEIALLIVKYSINEELKRLGVHLKEYFRLLEENAPVGKRLDFLSQEMNREVNTIGSKSQMASISSHVVMLKDTIENIREQIRNIE